MTEKLSGPLSVFMGLASYESMKPIIKAALEGYISASRSEFPPHNPYAICGMYAGEEDSNLEGAAWFEGFWEFFKRRDRENLPKI